MSNSMVRFHELVKLVKTDEQAAVLFCRMFNARKKEDLFAMMYDELSDLFDSEQEEAYNSGVQYLEELAKVAISDSIDETLQTDTTSHMKDGGAT